MKLLKNYHILKVNIKINLQNLLKYQHQINNLKPKIKIFLFRFKENYLKNLILQLRERKHQEVIKTGVSRLYKFVRKLRKMIKLNGFKIILKKIGIFTKNQLKIWVQKYLQELVAQMINLILDISFETLKLIKQAQENDTSKAHSTFQKTLLRLETFM